MSLVKALFLMRKREKTHNYYRVPSKKQWIINHHKKSTQKWRKFNWQFKSTIKNNKKKIWYANKFIWRERERKFIVTVNNFSKNCSRNWITNEKCEGGGNFLFMRQDQKKNVKKMMKCKLFSCENFKCHPKLLKAELGGSFPFSKIYDYDIFAFSHTRTIVFFKDGYKLPTKVKRTANN